MIDRTQLKVHGIRFARSLLMVFKTVNMFSAEHNAAAAPIQQSYAQLNEILKETGRFTIGFVDQRILLNNILTSEKNLQALENEFLKRGIAAVTFQAGLTQTGYRRGIGIIGKSPKVIEECGGIAQYIHENPLELMRVFPAGKNAIRNESGDTILDSDADSFLMAKAISEMRPTGGVMENLERMLQTSGLQGLPLSEGQQTDAAAGLGGGAGTRRGFGSGSGSATGSGSPTGQGAGSASGDGSGSGAAVAPARTSLVPEYGIGGPQGIQGLVENYFDSTVLDPEGAPQHSYVELAKVIQEMHPEMVLQNFSPSRREELRKLPPEQMAAEVIEDSAVKWAIDRLVAAPQGPEAIIVEEEVIRVLLRSLQATQMADRLARKLAQYVKDLNIPASTTSKIQQELEWVMVPSKKKTEALLQVQSFDRALFRRLLDHINDTVKQGERDQAVGLALHYCSFLDRPVIEMDELGRLPEVVRAMSSFRSSFLTDVVPKLTRLLVNDEANQLLHFQVVNSLTSVAKALAVFEEFEAIETIGKTMDQVAISNVTRHAGCCVRALDGLLSKNAVERIIELTLTRKDDSRWTRLAVALIRWAGQSAVEKVFQYLEEEQVATNRIALIRFISKIGPTALDVARTRIRHERWYVVRNTCKLLAELKDPDLLTHIAPALRHPDQRVQVAATKAIVESRMSDRGPVLVDALPHVHPAVRDEILDDLRFLKDPKIVNTLERFIFSENNGGLAVAVKAVLALSAIAGEQSESVLNQVMIDRSRELALRRSAYEALCQRKTVTAACRLIEFSRSGDDDPLAATVRQNLAWSGARE